MIQIQYHLIDDAVIKYLEQAPVLQLMTFMPKWILFKISWFHKYCSGKNVNPTIGGREPTARVGCLPTCKL